jgi:hypothetical protein
VIIGEIERLQALAASPSLRQGDFAEFQRQAEASLALLQIGNIVLIDRNMQELVNTWVPFGTHLGKAAVSESLVEWSLAIGKPQVAGLFIGGGAVPCKMISIIDRRPRAPVLRSIAFLKIARSASRRKSDRRSPSRTAAGTA